LVQKLFILLTAFLAMNPFYFSLNSSDLLNIPCGLLNIPYGLLDIPCGLLDIP